MVSITINLNSFMTLSKHWHHVATTFSIWRRQNFHSQWTDNNDKTRRDEFLFVEGIALVERLIKFYFIRQIVHTTRYSESFKNFERYLNHHNAKSFSTYFRERIMFHRVS